MYECCCEKISHNLKGSYQTFEEAKTAYEEVLQNSNEIKDDEVLEFLDLMEFVYIERRKK